jgi:hypothetical protein
MGCGANLKVTAISTPGVKKEQPEAPERRPHIARFKLPVEVLNGFENVLNVVTRKTLKRRKPNHLTDVPEPAGPSAVSDGTTLKEKQHEEKTKKKEMAMLGVSTEREQPPPAETAKPGSAASKHSGSWVNDIRESVVKELQEPQNASSLFQHIEEKPSDTSKFLKETDYEEAKVVHSPSSGAVNGDMSSLLSPEAPGMVSDDEEQSYDNETRRAARIELERSAQMEASRMAAFRRSEEDRVLEEQNGEMARMKNEAGSILSKYT